MMQATRRQFTKILTAASVAGVCLPKGFCMASPGVRLGLNTFSLRTLPRDTASVPFGEGEAPLAQVLKLLESQKLPIATYIDCDCPGTGNSSEEVARCVSFVRSAVATS